MRSIPVNPRPLTAVMKISRASGYRFSPTCRHHASIEVTANTGVSWSTPTLKNPDDRSSPIAATGLISVRLHPGAVPSQPRCGALSASNPVRCFENRRLKAGWSDDFLTKVLVAGVDYMRLP